MTTFNTYPLQEDWKSIVEKLDPKILPTPQAQCIASNIKEHLLKKGEAIIGTRWVQVFLAKVHK